MKRCDRADKSELEQSYHDHEWGVEIHDDRTLFEFLVLEGAQAGLSWSTILKKREGYRRAFDHFDARKISGYSEDAVSRLLANPEIIRNRLKMNAAITNARAFLQVQKEFGSFDRYLWQFVNGKPIRNSWKKMTAIPSSTTESVAMSKDLQKGASSSSGRQSAMPSCRPSAWSMIMSSTVSGTRNSRAKGKHSEPLHGIVETPGIAN